jgi:short-subunit dehydrogenase
VADILALNVMGTVYCIEAVLPGMLHRGHGHLVAVSSLAGYRGLPGAGAYSAAKAALTNLMESLRIDLSGHGIDVTVLLPGFVRTRPGQAAGKRGRPFRLALEDATARMERAIRTRRRRYAFPWVLAGVARLATWLPASVFDRLFGGRRRQRKHRGDQ